MANASTSRTIVLAAGGTGGHIFPAVALAEVLRARGFDPQLVTDHRFHHYNKASADGVFGQIPIHTIQAGSLGGGAIRKLRNTLGIGVGVLQAMRLLRQLKPLAVVGFGGYPSFPTMVAAIATWGFREIVLVICIAQRLDSTFKASEDFYAYVNIRLKYFHRSFQQTSEGT